MEPSHFTIAHFYFHRIVSEICSSFAMMIPFLWHIHEDGLPYKMTSPPFNRNSPFLRTTKFFLPHTRQSPLDLERWLINTLDPLIYQSSYRETRNPLGWST